MLLYMIFFVQNVNTSYPFEIFYMFLIIFVFWVKPFEESESSLYLQGNVARIYTFILAVTPNLD